MATNRTFRNSPPPLSKDGRYIVVDGRKWRVADPSVPPLLKMELVSELMAARRAIQTERENPVRVGHARARVSDAKHALGERGAPWWDTPSKSALDVRIRSAIRALTTKRGPRASVCPSEIARIVASPDWRPVLDQVRDVAGQLATEGEVRITASGTEVPDLHDHAGPVRIAAVS